MGQTGHQIKCRIREHIAAIRSNIQIFLISRTSASTSWALATLSTPRCLLLSYILWAKEPWKRWNNPHVSVIDEVLPPLCFAHYFYPLSLELASYEWRSCPHLYYSYNNTTIKYVFIYSSSISYCLLMMIPCGNRNLDHNYLFFFFISIIMRSSNIHLYSSLYSCTYFNTKTAETALWLLYSATKIMNTFSYSLYQ